MSKNIWSTSSASIFAILDSLEDVLRELSESSTVEHLRRVSLRLNVECTKLETLIEDVTADKKKVKIAGREMGE